MPQDRALHFFVLTISALQPSHFLYGTYPSTGILRQLATRRCIVSPEKSRVDEEVSRLPVEALAISRNAKTVLCCIPLSYSRFLYRFETRHLQL